MHHVTIGFAGFIRTNKALQGNHVRFVSHKWFYSVPPPAAILFLLSSLPYFALVCAATYSAERCDNRLSDPTSTVVSTPLHDVNPAEKPKSFIARFQQKASSAKMISHLSISTMIFDVIRRALLPFPLSSPSVFSMISTRTHRAKVLKVLKCSSHLRFLLAFLVAVLVIILC